MSGKVGERTVETNNEQKHALGKSANASANKFLADLRGCGVCVRYCGEEIATGILREFDLYCLIVGGESPRLVFKGPGITVERH
jgi:hypothetical protein